jgi:hypothetical protein
MQRLASIRNMLRPTTTYAADVYNACALERDLRNRASDGPVLVFLANERVSATSGFASRAPSFPLFSNAFGIWTAYESAIGTHLLELL